MDLQGQPILFYDGDCKLCNKAVNFIIDHERHSQLLFAPLQSKIAHDKLAAFDLPASIDSLIVLEKGQILIESAAAFRLCEYLNRPYRWLRFFRILPRKLTDLGYRWIARNRMKWFGNINQCKIYGPETMKRFLS